MLDALRERRVYATNGPRIVLRTSLDGYRMGASLPAPGTATLRIVAVTEAPIERIDVIRPGQPILRELGDGGRFAALEQELDGLEAGSYLYVRVVQEGGGAAWSSPFFFDPRDEE